MCAQQYFHSEIIAALLQQGMPEATSGRPCTPGHLTIEAVVLKVLGLFLTLLITLLVFLIVLVDIDLTVFSLETSIQ